MLFWELGVCGCYPAFDPFSHSHKSSASPGEQHQGGVLMQLVGYLRVSTDRQAEEGLGLEVQEQAIRQWAQAHGHELVALTRDEGISGSNGLDTRVGLGEA